jgi:hypothetical protein
MPYDKFVACELAASGYGSVADLLQARCDIVLSAYDHMITMREFEERFHQLNAPKEK